MRAASKSVATAKPTRSRKPVSSKLPTPAEKQRQRDQIARERTERLAHQAYQRQYRHAQIAIARQQARADAMKDAGVQAQPPQQPQPKSGQKPPARKPPKNSKRR